MEDGWRWETAEVRNILLRVHDGGSCGGRVEGEAGLYACSAERGEATEVSDRVVGGVLCRRLSLDEAPPGERSKALGLHGPRSRSHDGCSKAERHRSTSRVLAVASELG